MLIFIVRYFMQDYSVHPLLLEYNKKWLECYKIGKYQRMDYPTSIMKYMLIDDSQQRILDRGSCFPYS